MGSRVYGEGDDSREIYVNDVLRGKYKSSLNMAEHLALMIKQMDMLRAALRTIATDVHNESVRMQRGGRVDLETVDAWQKLADQVLAGCESSR